MIVVSDTSPLSSLLQINSIYLLKSIYGKIILPNAVMDELNRLESKGIDLSAIKNADWIEVKSVGVLGILVIAKNKKLINSVKEKIDEMKLKANFWIKEDLYKRVLESVNEI